jgi:hypothetical protein
MNYRDFRSNWHGLVSVLIKQNIVSVTLTTLTMSLLVYEFVYKLIQSLTDIQEQPRLTDRSTIKDTAVTKLM